MDSAKPASPTEVLKQLLKDPNFIESLRAEIAGKAAARAERYASFKKSDTFKEMLRSFQGFPNETCVSSDEIAYYLQDCKQYLNWDQFEDEDVKLFFDALSDASSPDIQPGSYTEDAKCPFPNCSFKTFGLTVRILSGQGTIVSISNR